MTHRGDGRAARSSRVSRAYGSTWASAREPLTRSAT